MIKETLGHIGKLLLSILLLVLAIILLIVLLPIAIVWKVYVSIFNENRKARDILDGTSQFIKAMAISIDVFGNVAYSGLFNNILSKKQIYKFGSPYETISEVLGWEQYYRDLSKEGKLLVKILDKVDPKHCEKTRVYSLILALRKIKRNHKNEM